MGTRPATSTGATMVGQWYVGTRIALPAGRLSVWCLEFYIETILIVINVLINQFLFDQTLILFFYKLRLDFAIVGNIMMNCF